MKLKTLIIGAALAVTSNANAYNAADTQAVLTYLEQAKNANAVYSTHPMSNIFKTHIAPSINVSKEALRMMGFAEAAANNNENLSGYSRYNINDSKTGFNAAIFVSNSEAILAFRGSELGIKDWITNGQQAAGILPTQYVQAISLAEQFASKYGNTRKISMVGHSLGGGLAATATLVTGVPTHAFGSAGTPKVALKYVKQRLRANGKRIATWKRNSTNIKHFNIEGEFVTDTDKQQDADALGIATYLYGDIYYLSSDRFNPALDSVDFLGVIDTPLQRHYTVVIKEELKFLSVAKYRVYPYSTTLRGNRIANGATNAFETSHCWLFVTYTDRDCTEDGWDIFVWDTNYLLDSIPSIFADLFVSM